MRAFVGIDITDGPTLAALARTRSLLGEPARRRHDHITLAFLGEIDEPTAAAAADALEAVEFGAFDAHIAGLGAFPSLGRPRVLWVGVREGSDQVSSLARSVVSALGPLCPPTRTRLVPHITVSRVKSGHAPPRAVISECRDAVIGVQRVDSISLKRSDLASDGHVHTTLKTVEAL